MGVGASVRSFIQCLPQKQGDGTILHILGCFDWPVFDFSRVRHALFAAGSVHGSVDGSDGLFPHKRKSGNTAKRLSSAQVIIVLS